MASTSTSTETYTAEDTTDWIRKPTVSGTTPTGQSERGLQCLSLNVPLKGIPHFNSYERERRWMLEHMAGAFRVFARKGFTEGLAGHISLRDPEHKDCYWTNPLLRHFGLMRVSDLVLINHDAEPIAGATHLPVNAAGFQIHGHIHEAYPHVNAACHAHSISGRAWASFGRRLEMLHQDVCNFYGDAHQVYNDFGGVVTDPVEGRRLAAALGPTGKGLILRNHGLLTVGKTVDEAAYLFTLMDSCCTIQLKAEAAIAGGARKILVKDEVARFTFESTSHPDGLYSDFQPDYEYELALSKGDLLG